MMNASETELEMVTRHVAAGERHVALQEDIVAHLRTLHGSTSLAEELLIEFRSTLDAHRAHLDRIRGDSPRPRARPRQL
jgi:predicted small metal-binding protein